MNAKVVMLVLWLCGYGLTQSCQAVDDKKTFTFAVGGDWSATEHTQKNLSAIRKLEPDFVVAAGDLSYGKIKPESAWCEYVYQHLGNQIPVVIISGNHEMHQTSDALLERFLEKMPDPVNSTGEYGRQYYFDYPGQNPLARFVMVPPDLRFSDGRHFQYQKDTVYYRWLETVIDDARDKKIPWLIVTMHKNCISAGAKNCETGSDIINLLITKKVDLIIQGHDHTYQRSGQLQHNEGCLELLPETFNSACVKSSKDNLFDKDKGPILLINGAFGAPLYKVNKKDTEAPYFEKLMGANQKPAYGFNHLIVSKESLKSRFVSAGKSNFNDEFEIRALAKSIRK